MAYFSTDELAQRLRRACQLMQRDGLDGLMVTGDFSAWRNYYYLSGHIPRDYQSSFREPHVMLLTQNGQGCLVVYAVNEKNAAEQSWVSDIRSYTVPFDATSVMAAIQDLGLAQARIGAELGLDQRLWMPVTEFRKLEAAFPQAQFVDASQTLGDLRAIKSPAEIRYIQEAVTIVGKALRTGFAAIQEGDSERTIQGKFLSAVVANGAVRPPHSQVQVVAEAKARSKGHRARMAGPTDTVLRRGDVLFVDPGAVYNGYWGEYSRMGVVGSPTPRQIEAHRNVRELVQRTVAEAIKPHLHFREVLERTAQVCQEMGLAKEVGQGFVAPPYKLIAHGIGLDSAEAPFVRADLDGSLQPGMVITVETTLVDDGITYGSEEDVVVTETGCDILSDLDTGLFPIATQGPSA